MFDASAYDLAELPDVHADGAPATVEPQPAPAAAQDGAASPLDVAMAACSLCTQTFGGCAISGARAGMVSPALAISVCGWMQRAAERSLRWNRTGTSSTYLAYVLLGNARSGTQREADVLALAETMR